MYLRLLNPEQDSELFRVIWNWQFEKHKSWREMFSIWSESEDDFYARAKKDSQLDFGVFDDDDNFNAVITLMEDRAGSFEASFDCRRGIKAKTLVDPISLVKQEVFRFDFVKDVYCYVADRNSVLKNILTSCGFHPTFVAIIKGEMRGKVISWEEYKIINEHILIAQI